MRTRDPYFTALLRLLPPSFRKRHGNELSALLEQMKRDLGPSIGPLPRIRLYAGVTWDVLRVTIVASFDHLWTDARIGARMMRRSPLVTLAALTTLALGIGGATAVFSVVESVVLDPTDFPEPNRLVRVYQQGVQEGTRGFSYEDFRDLEASARSLESVGVYRGLSVGVTGLGEPERVRGEFVSSSYFQVLGVPAAIGRSIGVGEDVPGGPRTAVLSHGYWERRFGSEPSILGRSVNFNDIPHTVVGVMPPDFRSYWDDTEVWLSLQTVATTAPFDLTRDSRPFAAIARLADGVPIQVAERELTQVQRRMAEAHPDQNGGWNEIRLLSLETSLLDPRARLFVWSLLGAVGFVLLIAAANVAGLQLSRNSRRRREMAIRGALGGGRLALVRQLLVENLVLAFLGGALGLGIAVAALRIIGAWSLGPFTEFDIGISVLSVVVASVVTLGTGIAAGLLPALGASAVRPAQCLGEGGRSGGAGPSSSRFRSHLVVAQMAMAVTLLVSASLLLRTAGALRDIEVGFEPGGILTAETRLTADRYQDPSARRIFQERVVSALAEIPGVTSASLIRGMPFAGDDEALQVRAESSSLGWDDVPYVRAAPISGEFFELMGIPVVEGRTFDRSDGPGSETAIVLSRTLADQLYPRSSAVGRLVQSPDGPARVVGVVEDILFGIRARPEPVAYLHYVQSPPSLFNVLIRTGGPVSGVAPALREAFWSVDPDQPLWEVMPLEQRVAEPSADHRFFSAVLAAFAGLSLVLASVGLYGGVAYSVSLREQELGVRIALGAGRGQILRTIHGHGAALTSLGLAIGIVGALGTSRVLSAVLFGIEPIDVISFTAAPVLLALVAASATHLPARRATRVSPVSAIRG